MNFIGGTGRIDVNGISCIGVCCQRLRADYGGLADTWRHIGLVGNKVSVNSTAGLTLIG